MNKGINKYRRNQDMKRRVDPVIEMDALMSDGAEFEEKVILSEEAAERLATEALMEDEDIEIEVKLPDTVHKGVKIDASTTAATTARVPNAPLGTRQEIIVEYAPLIKYIAQKIAARLPANIELDDLISSGVIGLMDAIEKYDPTRDNKFKTYAEFRIRGAILDELRAQDWVPRPVREKAKMLERAFAKIEHERGRAATDEEICEELKISQDEYHDLLNQVRSVSLLSYDDLNNLSKGDRRSVLGMSENGKSPTPFSEVNVAHLKTMISGAIKDLPEKQRLVLSLYYYEDLNLKEIGKVLDVTESRVSQLHTQAILRLKAKLKGNFDDFLMMFG
jgi:RNA polymerase sigma factor for flagellar operon FliA